MSAAALVGEVTVGRSASTAGTDANGSLASSPNASLLHRSSERGGASLRRSLEAGGSSMLFRFDSSVMPRLPDDARALVGSLLYALAAKYKPLDGSAPGGAARPVVRELSNLSLPSVDDDDDDDDDGGADRADRADDAAWAAPSPRLSGGMGARTSGAGADASMAAYAQWLHAEMAAEREAAARPPPPREPLRAEPRAEPGGDECEAPARACAAKRRPISRSAGRKPSTAVGGSRAERAGGAPARVNVSVRCAALVGREVWLVARETGSIGIHESQSGAHLETLLLLHHTVLTLAAARAPSGARTVWCGCESGAVLLYDAPRRALLRELTRQHAGGVLCLAVQPPLPDGKDAAAAGFVASGGADRRLCVYGADGAPKRAFQGHAAAVRCALILGAHVWSGADDGVVRVWDLAHAFWHLAQSNACVATLKPPAAEPHGAVRALLPSGGAHVLAGCEDGSVCKWEGAPHFACVLRVRCAGAVTALLPMGRRLWACCGKAAGVEVRDACSLQLVETLRARDAAGEAVGAGAVGALRAHAVERRTAWTWVPGEPCAHVWSREEADAPLSADEYARALDEAEALRAQLGAHCATLAALREQNRAERLRALAVQAALASELELALAANLGHAARIDALADEFMAQQANDLDEQRQLQRLCEQLEADNRRQDAEHARALDEATAREDALLREARELRRERDAARAELDKTHNALSTAYCERDLLRLHGSQLELELETRGEELCTLRLAGDVSTLAATSAASSLRRADSSAAALRRVDSAAAALFRGADGAAPSAALAIAADDDGRQAP